jgi:hypothetical protein
MHPQHTARGVKLKQPRCEHLPPLRAGTGALRAGGGEGARAFPPNRGHERDRWPESLGEAALSGCGYRLRSGMSVLDRFISSRW